MKREEKGSGGIMPPGMNVEHDPLANEVEQDAPLPLDPLLPVEIHANYLPHWQQGEAAQLVRDLASWRLCTER